MKRVEFLRCLLLIVLLRVTFGLADVNGQEEPGTRAGANEKTQLAVILDLTGRNHEPAGEAIALKHSFDILGIPYKITEDIHSALSYQIVYTAGSLKNTTLSPAELESLYSYVETGGVLVSSLVIGNKFFTLFGISQPNPSRQRYEVNFGGASIDDALKYIDRPEEKKISLGNKSFYPEIIWTNSFKVKDAKALGTTEDGMAVVAANDFGVGTSYVFGVSYTDIILLPHTGNDFEAQRGWSNIFEPGCDTFLLVLKGIYEKSLEPFIYLNTAPLSCRTTLLLSHDIDAQMSFKNAVDFAALEKEYHVSGTYFVTTKYFKDETDINYYTPEHIGYLKKIMDLGGDIGSHTVSHSKSFDSLAMGEETADFKSYQPQEAATVFGEVKVSKELLDSDLPLQNTVIFRGGELRFPESLVESLDKSGYKYDSTFSACDIMTNFAFRPLLHKNAGAVESRLVEIPVTFDDSQNMLRPDNVDEIVNKWLDIIEANASNEGISVLLIHPTETGYKMEAETKLLEALQNKDIWINNLTNYGAFWNLRDKVKYDAYLKDNKLTIKLQAEELPEGVSFVVKDAPSVKSIELVTGKGKKIKCSQLKRDHKIILKKV